MSSMTCAVTVVGAAPTNCTVNFVRIVTLIGNVKEKLSLCVGSVTEVAVIVGFAFAPLGGFAGGV
jgi:hypothetical protein